MNTPSRFVKSITETFPDDFPTLTPLTEAVSGSTSTTQSGNFLQNITWQTWVIVILILALLGINIFAYLAKGTEATASLFDKIFEPIFKLFGYTTLETTKQTIQNTAIGTTAAVNAAAGTTTTAVGVAAGTTTAAINTIEQQQQPSGITGQVAATSQPGLPITKQNAVQNAGQWQQDTLQKALNNAEQSGNVEPDNSQSSIQSSNTTGKSGWCYIGEDRGTRTCTDVGVNDVCMSGDVFPSQAICMNPNLRV